MDLSVRWFDMRLSPLHEIKVQWRQWLGLNVPPSHDQHVAKKVSVPRKMSIHIHQMNEWMKWPKGLSSLFFLCGIGCSSFLHLETPHSLNLMVLLSRGGNSVPIWLALFLVPLFLSLGLGALGSEKLYHHLIQPPTTEILLFWAESSIPHLVHRCPPSLVQRNITFQVGCTHLGTSPSFRAPYCFRALRGS